MLTDATRRQAFPTLEEMTYLDTAGEGIPPVQVGVALNQYFRDAQMGMEGRDAHAVEWQAVKALAGEMFGLASSNIGICSSSSEAYNLATLALQLQPGDEVVINDLDFPHGSLPWQQPASPATIKIWKARDGALRVEDLIPLLGPHTRLVPLSLVSFYNGYMVPLPALVEAVHRHSSALIALNVTQALGRIPLQLTGVDLIIASTHKWILGTHGGALVGVPAARAHEWTVPAGGFFHIENPYGSETFQRGVKKEGAASFAVGLPNYPAIYGIRAALNYIGRMGVEVIADSARPLVDACMAGLHDLELDVMTPNEPDALAGIIAFRHAEINALYRYLRDRKIFVRANAGRMRISIHGYNTPEDIDALLAALREALKYIPAK